MSKNTRGKCPHNVLYYWGSGRSTTKQDGVACAACDRRWRRVRRKIANTEVSTLEVVA